MELDKNKLLIKQLPPTIYIKNFIDGHPANYEDFLTTFINSSKLVTCKGNQAFILRKHEEQNHGEADIFNSFYDLDFKIMVDTKYMEARRMLSPTITEFCPGVVGKGPSRLKGERKVYDIIKCFRSMNIDDLIKIEKGLIKLPEGKTIIQVLKKVSVNKNMLLFLPYDYCFENTSTNAEVAKFIIDCISEDLQCGAKRNIARSLNERGCEVTIYPALTPAEEILEANPDGIMLSNGPGDPKECTSIIKEIKKLYDSEVPIFAICLGHQLMALATGGDTHKMKYGHRGGNHPVKDLATGRVYISSQNHGYVVDAEGLEEKNIAKPAFVNVNDGTNEGMAYEGKNIFTVQFHPEACPGPQDSSYLFDRFMDMMGGNK